MVTMKKYLELKKKYSERVKSKEFRLARYIDLLVEVCQKFPKVREYISKKITKG